jgi:thiol-disulfide isomerase/thioredoxin
MSRLFTYPGTIFLIVFTIFFAVIFAGFETGRKLLISKAGPSLIGASGSLNTKPGPSLSGASSWLNTKPLDLAGLRGKVVLIEFWTYTCINWRRALPYTREWALKYKDHGLVVIGVHTPEFSFEYKLANVSRAIDEMSIGYPVALDNDFKIWNSFQNQYWPALYLIDAKGKLRYQKFGEGDYAEAERQIQKILNEASVKDVSNDVIDLHPDGYEAAADWGQLLSPENYLGYTRTTGFASPQGIVTNKRLLYSLPKQLKLNQWALSGTWIMGKEHVQLSKGPGKLIYRFHARDLHLILGPAIPGTSVKFRVLIDGKPPGSAHGLDIDSNGAGKVTEQRMYQLVRQQVPVAERQFEIEFLDPGVEVYNFTFG